MTTEGRGGEERRSEKRVKIEVRKKQEIDTTEGRAEEKRSDRRKN